MDRRDNDEFDKAMADVARAITVAVLVGAACLAAVTLNFIFTH